jgi:uncharacterized protein (TIGR03086 family)
MDLTTMTDACNATEQVFARVTADQYDRPTACTEWNVRDVLNHVVSTLVLGKALLGDIPPAPGTGGPGALPELDLIGDDPLDAYRKAAAELLVAAGGDALARNHTTPLGEMPGFVLGGFTTLDIAVHGWDLAKATGQDATLETGMAETMLAFAQQTLSDDMRAPRIGPALPVADDAPATDRLVAFLGRMP